MSKKTIKGANKRRGIWNFKPLLFCALFILLFFSAKDVSPLFIKLMFWYPIGIIGLWAFLMSRRKRGLCCCGRKLDPLKALKITIAHTVFLMIAISSFMLVNQVVSSWYVVCDIFGIAFHEKVIEVARCLLFFILLIAIVMFKSMLAYKKFGLEHFSVIVHGVGLVGTLVCYISIIKSTENIELYGDRIMSCEGVYIESLILACIFLAFCDWVKKKNETYYNIRQ